MTWFTRAEIIQRDGERWDARPLPAGPACERCGRDDIVVHRELGICGNCREGIVIRD